MDCLDRTFVHKLSCYAHISGKGAVSYVVRALGIPDTHAMGSLRLSLGLFSSRSDVDRAAEAIVAAGQGSGRSTQAVLGLRKSRINFLLQKNYRHFRYFIRAFLFVNRCKLMSICSWRF